MKAFLFNTLFLLAVFNSLAQNYTPMPDTLASWREAWGYGNSFDDNIFVERYSYRAGGTEILDSLTYIRINDQWGHLHKYIRNDTNQRIVYVKDIWNGPEQILYDFKLQGGDTVPHSWYGMNSYDSIVVDTVDFVWLGSRQHKRLIMFAYWYDINDGHYWSKKCAITEGVGNYRGLFATLAEFTESGWASMECYSLRDSAYTSFLFTPYYSGPTCVLYNDIEFVGKEILDIAVFPNPVERTATVTISSDFQPNLRFFIFDITGKKILHKPISSSTSTVDCNNLSTGIYIWKLTNGETVLSSGKMIKE
ncbi:MAG TPA: T9SS type A sorting domain-containing protein [Chitinophagales bacterium]|nr:T9SS type A sorting domain-containing protein [Chitinophagales bacterium]